MPTIPYILNFFLCHPLAFISTRIELSIQWKEYVWHGFFLPYFPIVRVYCRCFLISQIAHNNNYICNCKYLSIRRRSKRKLCTKTKKYFQHITNISHSVIVRFNLTNEMFLFTFLFLFSSNCHVMIEKRVKEKKLELQFKIRGKKRQK